MTQARATVHKGPKGGTEYRLWTGPDTFRIVGKYAAWPYLPEEERQKAAAMETTRRQKAEARAEDDAAWRSILRGG